MTSITVALVSRTIFYAPVWVAEQNGYFRDEGVEARFEIFDNAEKINEAMHAGAARIAIEEGKEHARIFGLALAAVVAFGVMRFVDAVVVAWILLRSRA